MKRMLHYGLGALLVLSSLISFVNLTSENVQAPTLVSGFQFDGAGGPWNLAGSPYIVVGNVTVPFGQTLTVDAGVEVKFDGYYNLFVNGNMNAVGNLGNTITFTSNAFVPKTDDWMAITVNTTGSVIMDYCLVSHSVLGVFLNYSSNNIIQNSEITLNNMTGIYLYESSDNDITNNNVFSNGWYGIVLTNSSYNDITGNLIFNNKATIMGITFGAGIGLANTNYTNIVSNEISNNGGNSFGWNIILLGSSNNTIEYNELIGSQEGIEMARASPTDPPASYNTIRLNNISLSGDNGIDILSSDYNDISYNNVTNNEDGIIFDTSSYNSIVGNNVTSNTFEGIRLSDSYYNTIIGNNLSDNEFGIVIDAAPNNWIYHNNIINNTNQVNDDLDNNFWNDTYPSGGNYWSHYSPICVDDYDGAVTPQTSGSPDGICDVQYDIDLDSADFYPLTEPWGAPPVIPDTSGPSITNLQPPDSSTTSDDTPTISANYSDPSGINVSSIILKVDGVNVTPSATVTASCVSYTPVSALSDGSHDVYLKVNDTLRNQATASWSFTVDTTPPSDTTPPTITNLQPSDESTINDILPTISATFSDSSGIDLTSIIMRIDNEDVTSSSSVSGSGIIYSSTTPLEDGMHTVYLEVRDDSSNHNKATITWTFTVDTSGGGQSDDFLSQYWWLILLIIIIVVIGVILSVLMSRRRRRPTEVVPVTSVQTPPQAPPPRG